MPLQKLNTDNVDTLYITAQDKATARLTFNCDPAEVYSALGKIVVGTTFEAGASKTYTVGDGILLSNANKTAVWTFNPTDWGSGDAIGDFSLVRIADNQRDFKLEIKTLPSLL